MGGVAQRKSSYKKHNLKSLHSWYVWLNGGIGCTGRNKVVKERLQQVPQQTATPLGPVQCKISKSNAGEFEAPVGSAGYEKQDDIFTAGIYDWTVGQYKPERKLQEIN